MSEPDTIEVQPRPCWIAGHAEQGERTVTVLHPYDGTEIADVAVPGAAQVERAVEGAAAVADEFAACPAHVRADTCTVIADLIAERAEEIAETITAENGKPLKWAEAEVATAVATFRFGAEEARGLAVDAQRLAADGRLAVVRRRSRGPVLAVSPFDFPLVPMARDVAAAVAVGAPVVIRPAVATPMTALLLGEILAEAELPEGAFSVLPVADEALRGLVADPRLPVVSGTGSAAAGRSIAAGASGKHVVLEPAGTVLAIVCPDADPVGTAARVARFDVGRRVIVPAAVADSFLSALVDAVRALRTGNPHDPEVQVGPLISEAAAEQAVAWIASAVDAGGRLLTGGTRTGAGVAPTVLRDVPPSDDIPGPVLLVSVVDRIEDAFAQVRRTRTALFTHDVATAFDAATHIDGDVVVGDVSSDLGREGVRAAIREYTKDQLLLLRNVTL